MQKKFASIFICVCFAFVTCFFGVIYLLESSDNVLASGKISFQKTNIIATGENHTLLIAGGKLYACGGNYYGQLGDGTNINKTSPVRIGNQANWTSVSSGHDHSLAVNSLGELWAWGKNVSGQLGDGTTENKNAPERIGTQTNWVSVSAGSEHSLAINGMGELYAWGRNGSGQLGDGTTDDKKAPAKVGDQTNWVSISAGWNHSLAINVSGELYAWGNNDYGQLGDGTWGNNKKTPAKIGDETNWVVISAAVTHSLAINSSGELNIWGISFGFETPSPEKIGINANWVSVAGGFYHSLAINSLGELYAWGENFYGQLGNGTMEDKTAPIKIGTETNWTKIVAGYYHSFALNAHGELYAWGDNYYNQLGEGDIYKLEPTEVLIGNYDVAAPNHGPGYIVSDPSKSKVSFGKSYTFTIAMTPGFCSPVVKMNTTNGKLNLLSIKKNIYTYAITHVTDTIIANDFTVSVSKI